MQNLLPLTVSHVGCGAALTVKEQKNTTFKFCQLCVFVTVGVS